MLSLVSGAFGVVIAYGGVAALKASLPPSVPQPNPVEVGLVPMTFALATCLAVGVLFGLAPALQSSGVDAGETLKSKGAPGGSTTKRLHWLRSTLVAGEIALSLALLIGAGLLLRTLAHLRATEIGVQPANVLTAEVKLPESKYKTFVSLSTNSCKSCAYRRASRQRRLPRSCRYSAGTTATSIFLARKRGA